MNSFANCFRTKILTLSPIFFFFFFLNFWCVLDLNSQLCGTEISHVESKKPWLSWLSDSSLLEVTRFRSGSEWCRYHGSLSRGSPYAQEQSFHIWVILRCMNVVRKLWFEIWRKFKNVESTIWLAPFLACFFADLWEVKLKAKGWRQVENSFRAREGKWDDHRLQTKPPQDCGGSILTPVTSPAFARYEAHWAVSIA